jgi:hypothetical protein
VTFPSADQIAAAIVAGCRETGEDPVLFIEGHPDYRARHYAHHALVHLFPNAPRGSIARCVGGGRYFHRSSLWYVLGHGPHRSEPAAWWADAALGRVIEAIGGEPVAAVVTAPRPAPVSDIIWTAPPMAPEKGTKAYDRWILEQAVRNTAALQDRDVGK